MTNPQLQKIKDWLDSDFSQRLSGKEKIEKLSH